MKPLLSTLRTSGVIDPIETDFIVRICKELFSTNKPHMIILIPSEAFEAVVTTDHVHVTINDSECIEFEARIANGNRTVRFEFSVPIGHLLTRTEQSGANLASRLHAELDWQSSVLN